MAYCKYCGTELQDGEKCTCEKALAAQKKVEETSISDEKENIESSEEVTVKQTDVSAQTTKIVEDSKNILRWIWEYVKRIWMNPSLEGPLFVKQENLVLSIGFIVTQAILSGLLMLTVVSRIEKKIGNLLGGISSFLQEDSLGIEIPYAGIFFFILLISLAISGIYWICYYTTLRIMKSTKNGKEVLAFVSLRSIASIPFTLVSIVLMFLNMGLGLFVNGLALIIGYTFMLFGMGEEWSDSKKGYVTAGVNAIVMVILFIIVKTMINDAVEGLITELVSEIAYWF